ncbi:hypothetical protein C3L33_16452, partial [Rhododendron williamsianum]
MSHAGEEGKDGGEEENKAAWLLGVKTLRIQPYNLPPLGPHGVKVRVKAVGICGSDVHHFKHMRCGNFIVKKPMVIGHECAGIVEEIGCEVKSLQVVHTENLCFKLPDSVSLEEGAMCEPLSVGVHACRRAKVSPLTRVLIVGAGPIGLVTMLAARAFGAPKIVIVDIDDCRLSFAKGLGADETIQVSADIQDVEVDIVGIFRYTNTWPLCIEFMESGKIDVKPLITHRFEFRQEQVEEAFETSARGGNAIKVMFSL